MNKSNSRKIGILFMQTAILAGGIAYKVKDSILAKNTILFAIIEAILIACMIFFFIAPFKE